MPAHDIATPDARTDELRAEFLKRYDALTTLRFTALDTANGTAGLPDIDGLRPSVLQYLRSSPGAEELIRWHSSFTPAFDELDRAVAENEGSSVVRTPAEWWAGIRAEQLAFDALNDRIKMVLARQQAAESFT